MVMTSGPVSPDLIITECLGQKYHAAKGRSKSMKAKADTMAPGHVSAMARPAPKPKSSRERMLDAQKALHAQYEKPSMREWEDTHFPRDYATENAEARRRETRDTAIYAFVVFGIIAVVCVYVFWWSWK